MFTVYKVFGEKLSHKEHINNDELDAWMNNAYGVHATVKVVHDLSGKAITYTDDGQKFVRCN